MAVWKQFFVNFLDSYCILILPSRNMPNGFKLEFRKRMNKDFLLINIFFKFSSGAFLITSENAYASRGEDTTIICFAVFFYFPYIVSLGTFFSFIFVFVFDCCVFPIAVIPDNLFVFIPSSSSAVWAVVSLFTLIFHFLKMTFYSSFFFLE